MKNLLYLIPFIILALFIYLEADAKKAVNEEGIEFFHGTWEQALQKSAEKKKPIFLDVYATWCGPCKMLMGITFPDKKVGEYFNAHFINVEIDGESNEGEDLAERYGIRGYPSLFVIDAKGKVITGTAGFHTPSALIDFGKTAVSKSK